MTAMTEEEMVRAMVRQYDVTPERARRIIRCSDLAFSSQLPSRHRDPSSILRQGPSTERVPPFVGPPRGAAGISVLLHWVRDIRGGISLTLAVAPRTKKNGRSGAFFGLGGGKAYRAYRDAIVAAVATIPGERPLLPDHEYNCAATFYVDKRGELADINGLNQGLHDALENAGVVSDDWYFRTTDGTRIVFGDERPRVEVHITPLSAP